MTLNGASLQKIWAKLSSFPGGKCLFNLLIKIFIPYTGALGAKVIELKPGYSKIELKERRGIRNHLQSVHAIALANVGEMASGLAFSMGLPSDARAIVTSLKIDYLAKARGLLIAEGFAEIPKDSSPRDIEVLATIKNQEGVKVAELKVQWKIGPLRPKA